MSGDKISNATSGYQSNQQGNVTSEVEIALTLNGEGAKQYADISRKMVALPEPQNQLAATLDSKVIVAPRFNEAILDGRASITGGFTLDSARSLADQLKFGALPLSFVEQTSIDISPTLGSEQLRYGLIAGLIGLLLVVVYSLLQYRALGFVTVASILVAGLITYLTITILGWSHNYRLDMAGVTGLIVAIGFTADSFIVYFERVRDELRDGRSLAAAVETGWNRAKRTILVADGVNFLAALTLYALASSSVRGFAFTLGLTTLIDLLVVFLFTHPVLTLLARRPFFRDGHAWSGLDPRRLGVPTSVRYAGRGRFTTPATRPFRRHRRRCGMSFSFATFGNDLYTGKRSVPVVPHRRRFYLVSLVMIVIAVLGLVTQGLNLGLEFRGGSEFRVATTSTAAATTSRSPAAPSAPARTSAASASPSSATTPCACRPSGSPTPTARRCAPTWPRRSASPSPRSAAPSSAPRGVRR